MRTTIRRSNTEAYSIFYLDNGVWRGPYLGEIFASKEACRKIISSDKENLRKKTRIMKTNVKWTNA